MKDRVILTDADGVLLDWQSGFDQWMAVTQGLTLLKGGEHGYNISDRFDVSEDQGFQLVCEFNNSVEVAGLAAFRDAKEYVSKLHDQGYVLHVITSLSLQTLARKFRLMNLEMIFGTEVIQRLVCLDTGADKNQALSGYAGSGLYWIEDKISNADAGHQLGLKSILIDHGYNQVDGDLPYPRVENWKEIYQIITSGE
jgi:FMN phosphatase YigB (HAD superfamily)